MILQQADCETKDGVDPTSSVLCRKVKEYHENQSQSPGDLPCWKHHSLSHKFMQKEAALVDSVFTSAGRTWHTNVLQDSLQDLCPDQGLRVHNGRLDLTKTFAPLIALYASRDVDNFVQTKGFRDGLCGILRTFGSQIDGAIRIRDSTGSSKTWSDFHVVYHDSKSASISEGTTASQSHGNDLGRSSAMSQSRKSAQSLEEVALQMNRTSTLGISSLTEEEGDGVDHTDLPSLLQRMLAVRRTLPYETFTHPVACVIAVSAGDEVPIKKFQELYEQTRCRNHMSSCVDGEYLRYYLLIHDEDNDDMAQSLALFESMKKNFGLHCYLLRITGAQSDRFHDTQAYDSLNHKSESRSDMSSAYLESCDIVAVQSFARELIVQSILPFMERRITTWNSEISSRRRGFGGRIASISKRWAGITKSPSGEINKVLQTSNPDTDNGSGLYATHSLVAVMRQLADYATMIRDWKLASDIYDALRADYMHDSAWRYHAAATEMWIITSFLMSTPTSSSQADMITRSVEPLLYSYLTRSNLPFEAARCLLIVIELFRTCRLTAEQAPRWAVRLLELAILDPVMQQIISRAIVHHNVRQTALSDSKRLIRRRQALLWTQLLTGA